MNISSCDASYAIISTILKFQKIGNYGLETYSLDLMFSILVDIYLGSIQT